MAYRLTRLCFFFILIYLFIYILDTLRLYILYSRKASISRPYITMSFLVLVFLVVTLLFMCLLLGLMAICLSWRIGGTFEKSLIDREATAEISTMEQVGSSNGVSGADALHDSSDCLPTVVDTDTRPLDSETCDDQTLLHGSKADITKQLVLEALRTAGLTSS